MGFDANSENSVARWLYGAYQAVVRASIPVNSSGEELFTEELPGVVSMDELPLNPEIDVDGAIYGGDVEQLLDVRLDNDPTSFYSIAYDVEGWSGLWVWIDIISTLAPTSVRILPQFSYDGAVKWYDFEEGFWANCCWEDLDTAAEIFKVLLLPCMGIKLVRFGAIATGTDAGNFFDVDVRVSPFRGNSVVAHA